MQCAVGALRHNTVSVLKGGLCAAGSCGCLLATQQRQYKLQYHTISVDTSYSLIQGDTFIVPYFTYIS